MKERNEKYGINLTLTSFVPSIRSYPCTLCTFCTLYPQGGCNIEASYWARNLRTFISNIIEIQNFKHAQTLDTQIILLSINQQCFLKKAFFPLSPVDKRSKTVPFGMYLRHINANTLPIYYKKTYRFIVVYPFLQYP